MSASRCSYMIWHTNCIFTLKVKLAPEGCHFQQTFTIPQYGIKVKNEKTNFYTSIYYIDTFYNLISDSFFFHTWTFNQRQRKWVSLTAVMERHRGQWVNRLKKFFNRPYIPMVLKIHKTIFRRNCIPFSLLSCIYTPNKYLHLKHTHEGNQDYCRVPLSAYK